MLQVIYEKDYLLILNSNLMVALRFYLLTLSGPHICPSVSIAVGGSSKGRDGWTLRRERALGLWKEADIFIESFGGLWPCESQARL